MTTLSLEAAWLAGFRPPPSMTVSEWAARYRRLPEASAARGARWRNETAPYLIEIMDATLEPGAKQLAVVKAVQTGVSEATTNVIGHRMHHRPSSMLMVHPTASAATAYAKERLADMLRSTPELQAIVSDKRGAPKDGLPESTLAMKCFRADFWC